MKNRRMLAVLLLLALPLALARRVPAAPPGPAQVRPSEGEGMLVPEPLLWSARASPGAAAAALELLREEGAGPPAAPQKRDMHDFFVGLMGKRAAERGGGGSAPRCSPGPPAPGEPPLRAA
ncbi:tachykinin-3 [Hirundo rustica]|uniref:tachykinin-3 n=1 Tax=Hirundo rustica TaxID=43150 RepID=UPI001A93CA65|nr:tachykinin-3 [Hirundo rustica]